MFYLIKSGFIDRYLNELIATFAVIFTFLILRAVTRTLIKNFGKKAYLSDLRSQLVLKYTDFLISLLTITLLITVWGVKKEDIIWVWSSVVTFIGVAFFAQWSILSNVTAGIILFFSFPFKIGDRIRILDKDFPLEATIIDIKSFYTFLRTSQGEEVSYPNNLLLQKGVVIVSDPPQDEKI